MNADNKEIGLTDEERARRQKILDDLNEKAAQQITSWADLYSSLKDQAGAFFAEPNARSAGYTVLLFLTFVMALEDNPEEGDALKIVEKMNELLVFGEDRTGVCAVFAGEKPTAPPKADAILEALARAAVLLAVSTQAETEDTPTSATTEGKAKRTLH